MRVYCTKYALTAGITLQNAEETVNKNMVKIGPHHYLHGEGKEWHRDFDSAVKRAEELRVKKIDSLEKSLKRLRALEFKEI